MKYNVIQQLKFFSSVEWYIEKEILENLSVGHKVYFCQIKFISTT